MSQRMSLARSRASMAPGSVPSSVSARLAAKQAELQALQQLRAESAQLTQELARLSERVDTLVCGGQSVASVMASCRVCSVRFTLRKLRCIRTTIRRGRCQRPLCAYLCTTLHKRPQAGP